MITVALSGGLGNQMFQYAAAKALAIRLETEVELDLTSFFVNQGREWSRDFELGIFNLQVEKMRKYPSLRIKYAWKIMPYIRHLDWGQKLLLLNRIFRDKYAYQYDLRFERLGNRYILLGYFQSEKYFLPYCNQLLKEFSFKYPLTGLNYDMAQKILSTNAVSVHVRRGDYLMNSNASSIFAECSLAYYRKAMAWIKARESSPVFYFFSDDIAWVKQQFADLEEAVFVGFNHGKDSYNDMRLMSLCKHNIIANSSFSWWGAWLNRHIDKIVIAPNEWFKQSELNARVVDLIPGSWLRM